MYDDILGPHNYDEKAESTKEKKPSRSNRKIRKRKKGFTLQPKPILTSQTARKVL